MGLYGTQPRSHRYYRIAGVSRSFEGFDPLIDPDFTHCMLLTFYHATQL